MAEGLRILVVDDEPGMRTGVARALRDFSVHVPDFGEAVSFEIDQAATGEEALEKIAACPPQILLLDYKLPGITGLDVMERVKDRQQDMLTVMITAYATLETAVTATKQGAYDFLAKPFTPQELKTTVRKAAGRIIVARHARQLAQEKRQIRFQFISVVAHELKAPLGAVQGYLQLMKGRQLGEGLTAYDHMVGRCLVRIEQMRKLIVDLLDLTHIESGRRTRDLHELDVTEAAQAAIEGVLSEAAAAGIQVVLQAGPAVKMIADRDEIDIVLNNLLSNAVKYNREGGRVDVSVHEREGNVVIGVSDTGIGMSPDEAKRLFNDFVRIKNDKTRGILGSGLGLSIVKKLALLYGGDVNVESQPDVGSTFTVVLEQAPPPAEAQA